MKGQDTMNSHSTHSAMSMLLPTTIAVVTVAAVVAGLVLVGSPAQERRRWADGVRIQDLSSLKHEVDRLYRLHKRLPGSLDEVTGEGTELQRADPITKRPYFYRVIGGTEYELGATFVTDTSNDTESTSYRSEHFWYADTSLPFWKHKKGTQVFRLKVELPVQQDSMGIKS